MGGATSPQAELKLSETGEAEDEWDASDCSMLDTIRLILDNEVKGRLSNANSQQADLQRFGINKMRGERALRDLFQLAGTLCKLAA